MSPTDGTCDPAFRSVGEAFAEIQGRDPAGAAVAVWHQSRLVVDLWGGAAAGTRSWDRDTLVMPYSVSKPLTAVCVLLLVARGRLGLDARASTYWPELRCEATVRQLLDHSAGLVALERPAPASAFLDWEELCGRLAEQEPAWAAGSAVGESPLFYGHLLGELVRRVDGRSLGQFLRDEVCLPRRLDLHVGVRPEDQSRVADLVPAPGFPGDGGGPLRAAALGNPPGVADPGLVNSRAWRAAEVPAVNAHVTARAVAQLYWGLARGDILPRGLVDELSTVQASGVDAVTGSPAQWGLGVAIEPDGWGMGGLGGSLGWWSEEGGYALAFVTAYLDSHDRSAQLENAVRGSIGLPPL
ncbi:serine hydrolase domain-containing protein [Pedococcus sp. 5OH_020]|uniref:serine hydrolase domain-containing protein n=1 Tax=Pedococcus sp. 5OH_020 TaxID=2989814 RepID=UPI0022E9F8E9|nr:serine hydrolase domain-containing protein [Pedococcus sp. 5OH_020]